MRIRAARPEIRPVLAALFAASALGCKSGPLGIVSIEPRAAATANVLLNLVALESGATYEGDPEREPATYSFSATPEVRSYGWRASLNSEAVDLVFGEDRHRIDGEHVREHCLGLRLRSPKKDDSIGYFQVLWRHGYDFDGPSGSTDYDGIEAGGGALIQLDEHWFFDIGLSIESTFDRLEVHSGGRTEYVVDLLLHCGLVFAF